jgi:hypothetical protein
MVYSYTFIVWQYNIKEPRKPIWYIVLHLLSDKITRAIIYEDVLNYAFYLNDFDIDIVYTLYMHVEVELPTFNIKW